MLRVDVKVNQESWNDLMKALHGLASDNLLPRHLRAAVNKTVKSVRVQVAKELGKVMYLKSNYDSDFKKAKTLKKAIKAKAMATIENPTAIVQLSPGYPFPLKYYGAKPVVRKRKGKKVYEGVQYRFQPAKANPKWSRQRTLLDAFMIPRWGHNVYLRQGLNRKPITKAVGPAPGDYYEQIRAKDIAIKVANERLPIELKRRVRAILLERKGIIKLKASRGVA